MELGPDWSMVILTIINIILTSVYVVATIIISKSNRQSADAANAALEESKKQFTQSFELQQKSTEAAIGALEESKNQFKQNIELQKQYNRDSVRPALSVDFSTDSKDGVFFGRVKITNHGLGPAIIKALVFKKDGKPIVNNNQYCTFLDLVCKRAEEMNLQLPINEIFTCYTKEFRDLSHDTDFLAVNESLTLLVFRARDQGEARDVGKIFNGVTMELVYANIYAEDQPHIIKRLGYFQPDWVGSQDTYEFLMRQ